MHIPHLPKLLNSRSIVYLDKSSFTLDASGVAGFFGGTEAVSAIATVHICRNRKQWGWYNAPGSYEIARSYGLLTKFGFFFGGGHADPSELLTLFELDGRKGPPFLRVHSGNIIPETDHLAAVFMKGCASPKRPITSQNGRQPVRVTIAELDSCPDVCMDLLPMPTPWDSRVLATLPIVVSAAACAMCGVVQDWYSFSLILLGIVANGVACLVIGSVRLKFRRPQLAGESDQGKQSSNDTETHRVSGIFILPSSILLLKGSEEAAMAVAHGKFVLPGGIFFYKSIGWCSILLLAQFIVQLLLIPQGALFGQIMFVTSLAASWCYNLWLCSIDKTEIQERILLERILKLKEGAVKRYQLDNWPAMVVFVLLTLVLEDDEVDDLERGLQGVLDVFIEDTNDVWGIWKLMVLKHLERLKKLKPLISEDLDLAKDLELSDERAGRLSRMDGFKLRALLREAQSGIEMFKERSRFVRVVDDRHLTT